MGKKERVKVKNRNESSYQLWDGLVESTMSLWGSTGLPDFGIPCALKTLKAKKKILLIFLIQFWNEIKDLQFWLVEFVLKLFFIYLIIVLLIKNIKYQHCELNLL